MAEKLSGNSLLGGSRFHDDGIVGVRECEEEALFSRGARNASCDDHESLDEGS
jgi:hypothetical protein